MYTLSVFIGFLLVFLLASQSSGGAVSNNNTQKHNNSNLSEIFPDTNKLHNISRGRGLTFLRH